MSEFALLLGLADLFDKLGDLVGRNDAYKAVNRLISHFKKKKRAKK